MFALRYAPLLRTTALSSRTRTFVSSLYKQQMKYTIEHEWVNLENGIAKVGITDYAQKALGDVVYVELPTLGTIVTAAEQIGAVESVKAASDIFAPLSGEIESINETLGDSPGLLNTSPEADGWLCTIKLSKPEEFDNLLSAEGYGAHCRGESETS